MCGWMLLPPVPVASLAIARCTTGTGGYTWGQPSAEVGVVLPESIVVLPESLDGKCPRKKAATFRMCGGQKSPTIVGL